MKFKVINERTKEVVGSGLAIHGAREVARKYNVTEKVDYFYIKEQKELDKPHNNGEEISKVIKREINELLTNMINQYPNDASLGAAIRKSYK
tara:strand:- start:130 stop:405 length:276 start_codon:yes stop_codon:yes gene_type:complete